jgi:hypothetical protein
MTGALREAVVCNWCLDKAPRDEETVQVEENMKKSY